MRVAEGGRKEDSDPHHSQAVGGARWSHVGWEVGLSFRFSVCLSHLLTGCWSGNPVPICRASQMLMTMGGSSAL